MVCAGTLFNLSSSENDVILPIAQIKNKTPRVRDIKLGTPHPSAVWNIDGKHRSVWLQYLVLPFVKGLLNILVRQPKIAVLKLFHLRTPL